MWIESHTNLARHPKTRRLMKLLGWSLPDTIGNLHLLWWWALDFAPTGDLTRFDPDQLTADLDLGDATPEQFLEAMIHAGFMDRLGSDSAESRSGGTMIAAGFLDKSESGVVRIHDWPEYTAKSLRPKFRRHPERWHQVLRSYGLPVITRRRSPRPHEMRSSAAYVGEIAPAPEQVVPPSAMREPQLAGSALRVDPKIPALDSANTLGDPFTEPEHQPAPQTFTRHTSSRPGGMGVAATQAEQQPDQATSQLFHPSTAAPIRPAPAVDEQEEFRSELPANLWRQPGFVKHWWPLYLDFHKNAGTPLSKAEQAKALERFGKAPLSAIQQIKAGIKQTVRGSFSDSHHSGSLLEHPP